MDKNLPTSGQLERTLAQSIQKLYRQELKHSPSKITCQLFGNQLAIV
ncbi:MAG: Na-translocating system protein MpsC family protein, partial [Waterburya sp.]